MAVNKKNLLIVGDAVSNKNELLMVYYYGPQMCIPIVCQNFRIDVDIDGRKVSLNVTSTAGQEEFDFMKRLTYKEQDVIMMCFSIGDPISLKNIKSEWMPEITKFCPRVPVILVGNRKELRNNRSTVDHLKQYNLKPVSYEEGKAFAREISAITYLECSSENDEGLQNVFETCARATLKSKSIRNCNIM